MDLLEMEQLLLPLSAERFSSLESDILENGCYAPIIINENVVIIDGHNRFRICGKHGLSYQMLVVSFADLIAQLTVRAHLSLKEALGDKEMSINRGWKILKAVQQLPLEEQESAAVDMLLAVRKIDQLEAEPDHRHKIAAIFCNAYEEAVLVTLMLENVRCWTDCTRMRPKRIEDSMKDSYELSQVFRVIGDLLKNEILCANQQAGAHSDDD